jgi:hypothetical protein
VNHQSIRWAPNGPNPPSPTIPRYLPDLTLPAYAFVPGQAPHPISDPRGHSFGVAPEQFAPPDPEAWSSCRPYLAGVDLFNHGYYWEAHEAWEGLWHACGRSGPTSTFLKGLIHLAAAGVKVREGKPEGVRSHALRAAELFRQAALSADVKEGRFMGQHLPELQDFATTVANQGPPLPPGAERVVFQHILHLA